MAPNHKGAIFMLCQECKKKPTCTKLCERAEKWVNQDHVSLREIPKPEWLLARLNVKAKPPHKLPVLQSYFSQEKINFPFLTPLQNKCLHLFYFEGLSYKQIARSLSGGKRKLKINHTQVSYQIRSAKCQILQFSSDYREK
jgi:hypothetical protein